MERLTSIRGLIEVLSYVRNWPLLLGVYVGLLAGAQLRFNDGELLFASKQTLGLVTEGIYTRRNSRYGIRAALSTKRERIILTPDGFRLQMAERLSYELNEIFVDRIYGNTDLRGWVAIDIGAGIGDSSLYLAGLGASQVYAYEPNPELCETAKRNVEINGMSQVIRVFDWAVTGGLGPHSLANIISGLQSSAIFLKADCEGCELDIFLNTKESVLQRIQEIVFECHNDSTAIASRLSRLGYRVKYKKHAQNGIVHSVKM